MQIDVCVVGWCRGRLKYETKPLTLYPYQYSVGISIYNNSPHVLSSIRQEDPGSVHIKTRPTPSMRVAVSCTHTALYRTIGA